MSARDYKQVNLDLAVVSCFLITPSDAADLAEHAVALRIWNPEATAQTISLETVDGDAVTLTVPASSLVIEPLYVAKVNATNTGANLIIHGYR